MGVRTAARKHAHADDQRAAWEFSVTVAVYSASIAIALWSIGTWWLMLPAMLMAATSGLRIFIILHDCLHHSFFSSRTSNDWVGTLLSPIAMTPYKSTQYIHNLHHAHVSDLNRRDSFEIDVMTLDEWNVAATWKRLCYRIYRNPIVLILVGPFLLFAMVRRVPICGLREAPGDLLLHNLLVAAYFGGVWYLTGWAGVTVLLGTIHIGTVIGALISYIFHNFEHIKWGRKPSLEFQSAALNGSSVLDWGSLFDVATMNIAYHDLHHLNAKIPGYKLKAAHRDLEMRGLLQSERIGFLDGLRCLRWKLYDERAGKMIAFPKSVGA